MKKQFNAFVMSSIYGLYKKEKLLFEIAIKEIGLNPSEVILVDDSESNLEVAEEFGMIPILIDRYDDENLKSKYPIGEDFFIPQIAMEKYIM